MTLRARILVADDQRDVATTLTAGLRDAGASLSYVTDGETALQRVKEGGFDLVLLDMKMPPGDWGGLWLLAEFRDLGVRVPVIALSGEGGQRQTIEAMRMGAHDWVDKGAAGVELLERCSELLDKVRGESIAAAATSLPSPVAHDIFRCVTASDLERSTKHALHALESVVRFSALMSLADRDDTARGIPGVSTPQFTRPSLGTWLTAARALAADERVESPGSSWLAAVVPDKSSLPPLQQLVKLRNDLSHAGHEPTDAEADAARRCLTDVSHRLTSAWRWQLHEADAMEFDGEAFDVRTRVHAGTSSPVPSTFRSGSPVRTGELFLVGPEGRVILMAPWLARLEDPSGAIGVYDTVALGRSGSDDGPISYVDPATRRRGLSSADPGARWSQIRHHLER